MPSEHLHAHQSGDALHRYRRYLRIEVTLFLAAVAGAFALNGYAYLEMYYSTLEIPIDRLNFSFQKISVYGGASLTSLLTAFLAALALVAFSTFMIALSERPGRTFVAAPTRAAWIVRLQQRTAELALPGKILAAILAVTALALVLQYLTLSLPSESGQRNALKTIKECQEQTLYYKNLDTYSGCLISESDDMFYLVKRLSTEQKRLRYRTFQLPKAGLVKSQSQDQYLPL
ncbi:hypothetical protein C4K22_2748 [Pseudomonas chlororaphis subsp. aurantiaca]|uniref:hypothetical protein n=1 Tax=Pseudomonas chlororaphis TaxID=587753 RepID=UPI000F57C6EA|nr:hypothetical protein [Pseudomonas chlororaphis]AZD35491.1 hypothetical protein C4K22_2748 [Pseudomonas chlororaphis subsp. aurantiaca]AZD41825.1 hypothetical protein C4K21_2751 [Pseudomonas chlororaphis subsp. aurantiaca]